MAVENIKKNERKKIYSDIKGSLFIHRDALLSWINNFIVHSFPTIDTNKMEIKFSEFNSLSKFEINIALQKPITYEIIQAMQKELHYEISNKFKISVVSINVIQDL